MLLKRTAYHLGHAKEIDAIESIHVKIQHCY